MSISARVREQLISSFRAELAEHIQTMTDGLLALEQGIVESDERGTTLENIFRAAHSLKGASRAMGVTAVEQLAHALEGVLDGLRHDTIEPTPDLFSACYQALDSMQRVQSAYESGATAPPAQALQALANLEPFRALTPDVSANGVLQPEETAQQSSTVDTGSTPVDIPARSLPPNGTAADETIRVSVGKLDALMDQLSELLVARIRAEQRLEKVRQCQDSVAKWQREWSSVRSDYGLLLRHSASNGHRLSDVAKQTASLLGYVNSNQELLGELSTVINDLAREYASDTLHMSLVVDALEEEIKRVRMLPLNTITGAFARMVRDLARTAGKEVVLQIVGGETELDKRVLEQIKDPLIHLLRNAVDHGIETPERREALGKPRRGTITLTAEQLGKDVIICVSDDGSGLDLDGIRQAVARRGQVAPQLLKESELVESIFSAGISTTPIITDISGRGVGLDVVRRNIELLQGHIGVEWVLDEGTTFTLTLPLAMTSSHNLLVRVSDSLFAIPLSAVERIESVSPHEILTLEGRDTVLCNDQPVALIQLGNVLELSPSGCSQDKPSPVVVLREAERCVAFAVDDLVGEQEVVMKGLGSRLERVGGIAGATVMGDGEVVLILNPADLIKLARQGNYPSGRSTPAHQKLLRGDPAQQRILIVDDSITTRTLEKNILEAAGYAVELATDGEEAWTIINSGKMPDLLVSDVSMPRLDGVELAKRVKGEPRTAHMPVILVTSLDSPQDKARGIEAGANAYITKGTFDQNNLLETIEQLI